MNCKFYGRYPFCKQCSQTGEKCDDYYGEQKCIEVQVNFMLEE